jgi:hypothetical protein
MHLNPSSNNKLKTRRPQFPLSHPTTPLSLYSPQPGIELPALARALATSLARAPSSTHEPPPSPLQAAPARSGRPLLSSQCQLLLAALAASRCGRAYLRWPRQPARSAVAPTVPLVDLPMEAQAPHGRMGSSLPRSRLPAPVAPSRTYWKCRLLLVSPWAHH